MNCPACAVRATDPELIAACASVGTTHNEPTSQVLDNYLTGYHERNHQ